VRGMLRASLILSSGESGYLLWLLIDECSWGLVGSRHSALLCPFLRPWGQTFLAVWRIDGPAVTKIPFPAADPETSLRHGAQHQNLISKSSIEHRAPENRETCLVTAEYLVGRGVQVAFGIDKCAVLQGGDLEKPIAERYESNFPSSVQRLDFALSRQLWFSLEYNGGRSEAVGSASPASRQVCVAPDNLTFFTPSIWPLGFRDAGPGICSEGTSWQPRSVKKGRRRIGLPGIADLFRVRHQGG